MKIGRNIWLGVSALILLGSFFMPNAVARYTDSRRLDNLITLDAQTISYERVPELSLPERITIAASPNTEMLTLKTGQVMNIETAGNRAVRELSRFFRGGAFEFFTERCVIEDGAALFLIDTADPSVSMIIWEFTLYDSAGNEVTVTLDDDTGIILKLLYKTGSRNSGVGASNSGFASATDSDLNAAALSLSEMMQIYFNTTIVLGDYEFSGSFAYYRADMTGSSSIIPMYGIVRANSFTMNERL